MNIDRLISDSHLSREEIKIISEAFEKDKENVLEATRGELRKFIIKDYGAANMQSLGGFEGVVALQKALKVNPADGSFGLDTFRALIEYQKANGLNPDGIAGGETQKRLNLSMSTIYEPGAFPAPRKQRSSDVVKKDKLGSDTLGGIIVNVSTDSSESFPKLDASKILGRYEIRLKQIQDSLSDVRKYRDENTGFFNVLGDDIVGAFGGETGRASYERAYENIKNQAKDAIGKLDADLNGKYLTDTERSQYLRIRSELEKCLGQKLGEPNPFVTMKNSLVDTPTSVKNAVKGTAGVFVGTVETAWGALTGALDLTIFMNRYAASYIAQYVGIEPEYKNKMDAEISKIWTAINGMNFTKEQVFDAIGKGFDQIKGDPYAIGKLSGIVIGILLPIKGASALNNVVRGKNATANAAEVAATNAARLGKPAEIATAKVAAEAASKQAKIWKMGAFILNGPAEELIGIGLSKSFRFVANTLRGGASAAHKLKTVESGIKGFEEAIGNETHRPGIESSRLKVLREAKEALEAERNNLLKEPKKGTRAPEVDSGGEKKFTYNATDTLDKNVKRFRSAYSSDKIAHSGTPEEIIKADEIMKQFNIRKDALESARKSGDDQTIKVAEKDIEGFMKDPEKYLKEKGPKIPKLTPHEEFIINLEKYQSQFSESFLRGLAKKDANQFGEALLHKRTLEEISTLAKTDPDRAIAEFNAFMKSPRQYLANKFSSPYMTVDSEIRDHARWAYEGKYRAEGEELMASRRQAYEKFLQANPDAKIAMSEIQNLADSLRATFKNLAEELDKILASILESAGANLKGVGEKIDAFLEKIRLVPEMSLSLKAEISQKLRAIREKYFAKAEKEIPKTEREFPKSPVHESPKNYTNQEAPHVPEKGLLEFDLKDFPVHELSGDANKFFYDSNIPKPTHKIMVNGKEFIMTGVFEGGGNKTVLGYAKVDGRYEPRYFYFSNSGANWHAAPGVDRATKEGTLRISKGEQWNLNGYTKGTVVSDELQNAFGNLPRVQGPSNITELWADKVGVLNHPHDPINDVASKGQFREFQNRHTIDVSEGSGMNKNTTINDLRNMDINRSMDLSFPGGFKSGEPMLHERFGPVNTTIGNTVYNGQPVEVVFAHAVNSPNLVWIENIRLPNCPVDSHGIPQVIFNGGLLTAKPAEYLSGVPKFIKDNPERFEQFILNGRKYVDIRPALQDNPLVVQFKQLNGMRQAA